MKLIPKDVILAMGGVNNNFDLFFVKKLNMN